MQLTDYDIEDLSPLFEHIPNLTVLSFSCISYIFFFIYIGNKITDRGLASLSKYINFSSSFESIYLDSIFFKI